jgi:hypothetical protein
MFVKYIQQETGTRVQIKGIGSGFVDQETGKESDEPMHIHITCVILDSPPQKKKKKISNLNHETVARMIHKWPAPNC